MYIIYTCIAQAGSSRRDFSNSSSDYNHRHDSHIRSSRDSSSSSSSHRRPSGRLSSPPRNSRSSGDRSKERMGPPSRPPMKKFRGPLKGNGGSGSTSIDRSPRDSAPPRSSIKKTKIVPSASRSTVVRRRLVLRQRDSARRVKLARLRRYRMINVFHQKKTIYCLFSNTQDTSQHGSMIPEQCMCKSTTRCEILEKAKKKPQRKKKYIKQINVLSPHHHTITQNQIPLFPVLTHFTFE